MNKLLLPLSCLLDTLLFGYSTQTTLTFSHFFGLDKFFYLSLATPSSRWLISLLSVTQALSHFSHHGLSHLHNKTSVTTPIKINISHTHIHTHIHLHSSPCTLLSVYDIYYYLMPFSLLVYFYLSPSLEYKLHKIRDKLVPC